MSSQISATFLATLISTILMASPSWGRQQGYFLKLDSGSYDDRMQMYSDWAQTTHGRRLSGALSPAAAPSSKGMGDGTCKVLKYNSGYAKMTLSYDKIVKNSPNFGDCCHACQQDPNCLAWSRVAGGDSANFRNCYLKYSLTDLDTSSKNNHEGHSGDSTNYPELRYTDTDHPAILESGTIADIYPSDYYGCPYATGPGDNSCAPPPGCNVDANGVSVGPPCIG